VSLLSEDELRRCGRAIGRRRDREHGDLVPVTEQGLLEDRARTPAMRAVVFIDVDEDDLAAIIAQVSGRSPELGRREAWGRRRLVWPGSSAATQHDSNAIEDSRIGSIVMCKSASRCAVLWFHGQVLPSRAAPESAAGRPSENHALQRPHRGPDRRPAVHHAVHGR